MNVIVQSKTMVITEAIRNFAIRQTRKLLRRGQKIGNVFVFLETVKRKKNDEFAAIAKFYVDLPGRNIVVQEKAKDIYLAMHDAAAATLRQIGRSKEKRTTLKKLRLSPL